MAEAAKRIIPVFTASAESVLQPDHPWFEDWPIHTTSAPYRWRGWKNEDGTWHREPVIVDVVGGNSE